MFPPDSLSFGELLAHATVLLLQSCSCLPGAAAFGGTCPDPVGEAAGLDLFPAKLPVALFLPRLCVAPPASPNFYLTATVLIPYNPLVQYSAPVSPGLFSFWSASVPAFRRQAYRLLLRNPNLTFWSHPCPLFAYRTACPCAASPLPTAATAALPATSSIPASASTTPAKSPGPSPSISSPANCPISSRESTSPPTI